MRSPHPDGSRSEMMTTNGASGLFQDRVRERDLDNFLVEELQASEAFRAWLLGRLPGTFRPPGGADIRLQKSPPRLDGRQTDVRLGWFEGGQLKACVLIESKITADFQPGQVEAYVQEARRHRDDLGDTHCCTLLVAPAARLVSLNYAGFDAAVAVEEMSASLATRLHDDGLDPEVRARLSVRIDLLDALAGKRTTGAWTPVTIGGKRDFALAYAALAQEMVPALRVRPSTDGPKALTRFFDGLQVPANFPTRLLLKHEFGAVGETKYANLQFSGASAHAEAVQASGLIAGTPFSIARSDKSLFIRGLTPGLDPTADFDAQREEVVEGIAMVGRLADWFANKAPRLAELLTSAGDPPSGDRTVAAPTAQEFDRAMRGLCEASIRIGYRPGYLIDMIELSGGLQTARALLARPQVSEGFGRLWELDHAELTVEALVLQPRWVGLFTEPERDAARRRLKGWRGLQAK